MNSWDRHHEENNMVEDEEVALMESNHLIRQKIRSLPPLFSKIYTQLLRAGNESTVKLLEIIMDLKIEADPNAYANALLDILHSKPIGDIKRQVDDYYVLFNMMVQQSHTAFIQTNFQRFVDIHKKFVDNVEVKDSINKVQQHILLRTALILNSKIFTELSDEQLQSQLFKEYFQIGYLAYWYNPNAKELQSIIFSTMHRLVSAKRRQISIYLEKTFNFLLNQHWNSNTTESQARLAVVLKIISIIIGFIPSNGIIAICRILLEIPRKNKDESTLLLTYECFTKLFKNAYFVLPPKSLLQIVTGVVYSPIEEFSGIVLEKYTESACEGLSTFPKYKDGVDESIQQESAELCVTFFVRLIEHCFSTHMKNKLVRTSLVSIRKLLTIYVPLFFGPHATNIFEALQQSLRVQNKGHMRELFQLIGSVFVAFGIKAFKVAIPLLTTLDNMQFDCEETDPLRFKIHRVFGEAVKAFGVENIVKSFPLGRSEAPRLYLIAQMNGQLINERMHFFWIYFHDKIVKLQNKIKRLEPESRPVKECEGIIHQIWELLPGFVLYPRDFKRAWHEHYFEMFCNFLNKPLEQPEITMIVCRCLARLVQSNRDYLQYQNDPEVLEKLNMGMKSAFNTNHSQFILDTISKNCEVFLPKLFELIIDTNTPKVLLEPISMCITKLASIAPQNLLNTYFSATMIKIVTAEAQNNGPEAYPLLEMTKAMIDYLSVKSLDTFSNYMVKLLAVSHIGIQKKIFKCFNRLLKNARTPAKYPACKEVVDNLNFMNPIMEQLKKHQQSVKESNLVHLRLKALHHITILAPQDWIIGHYKFILSDIVTVMHLSKKCTDESYALATTLFKKMIFNAPNLVKLPPPKPQLIATSTQFITEIGAGLGGHHDDTISNTVRLLTHVTYDFSNYYESALPTMADAVFTLLDLNLARRIGHAVMDFVKMCISTIDKAVLKPYIPKLIKQLIYFQQKNSSGNTLQRLKIILERMIRLYSFKEIINYMPLEHHRLVKHVRDSLKRQAKREKAKAKRAKMESKHISTISISSQALDLNDPSLAAKSKMSVSDSMHDDDNDDEMITTDEKTGKIVIKMNRKRKRSDIEEIQDDYNAEEREERHAESLIPQHMRHTSFINESNTASNDEYDPTNHSHHYLELKKKQRAKAERFASVNFGTKYRSKKGAGDAVSNKAKHQPFAYLPLDPLALNRRMQFRNSVFDEFAKKTKTKRGAKRIKK